MVYHGKPSAGCEQCRNAKKGCDMALPSCKRCVRRDVPCTGRRDPTNLRIKDETKAVGVRVSGKAGLDISQPPPTASSNISAVFRDARVPICSFSSEDGKSDSSSSWDYTALTTALYSSATRPDATRNFNPTVSDIATNYFILQFTSAVDWACVRSYAETSTLEPCLNLAIKACGMAAFDNTHNVPEGRKHARSLYTDAVGLVNAALRDSVRSQDDQSLIAVVMLGYYEKLTCDSSNSIQMWRAHMDGATQLLKLRGKDQFKSPQGRLLFRDLRGQIIISCFWGNVCPPRFLMDWQEEVETQTAVTRFAPADLLADICLDFAALRASISSGTITDAEASDESAQIDNRLIQWSITTPASDPCWSYSEIDVEDSVDVWNGKLHVYTSPKAPQVWNSYRGIRIMVIRTREMLRKRLRGDSLVREEETLYFKIVRQQMANDICAAIPFALGRSEATFSSACVLMTATTAVWPLFFAGTCALELEKHQRSDEQFFDAENASNGAKQMAWINEQFDFIYKHVGLRWVRAVAAPLRGCSGLNEDSMKLLMWFGLM